MSPLRALANIALMVVLAALIVTGVQEFYGFERGWDWSLVWK